LLCVLALALSPYRAFASVVHGGQYGGCTWEIDEDENLVIRPTDGTYGLLEDERYQVRNESSDDEEPTYTYVFPWKDYAFKTVRIIDGVETGKTVNLGLSWNDKLESADLSGLDTTNATSINFLFGQCENLEHVDLTGWNTKNVEELTNVFSGCSSLESLDLSSFDTTNVVTMQGLFSGCSALETLNLSSFKTPKLADVTRCSTGAACSENLTSQIWIAARLRLQHMARIPSTVLERCTSTAIFRV
jgi:surface protein